MNVFYTINGKKLKQAAFLIVAVIFAASVIYVERHHVTVFSHDEPAAIYSVNTDQKVIALTFDISWGDRTVIQVLDALKEKGVEKATFFLSSPWSKQHPEITERIVKEGFEIGSHGHVYANYSTFSDEEIRKQLMTANQILLETTGRQPTLLRLPNGDYDKRVLQEANRLGLTVIQWDTDSLDYRNPGVDNIVNRVVSQAHPGDIVLLHASDTAEQTHLALPKIIDKLRAMGYTFATVSELINHTALNSREVRDNS
jgi:polysaccharide deacetylase family sporulation protein PdaB